MDPAQVASDTAVELGRIFTDKPLSQSSESPKWISVALRPPGKCTGYPIMLNNNKFVLPIGDHQLIKYNARCNEWSLFLTMENPMKFEQRAVDIDSTTNRMYLSGSQSDIAIIDLENGSIIHQKNEYIKHRGSNPGMVCADGVVHKVGGMKCTQHVIWKPQNKAHHGHNTCSVICMFRQKWCSAPKRTDVRTLEDYKQITVRKPFVLYVPSKRIILMIGTVHSALGVGLWKYDIVNDHWSQMFPKYSAISEDMTEISDISGCSFILTSDEKYVLILSDPIKILDIRFEKYRLRESAVSPPLASQCYIARSAGNFIFETCGYIRKLFASDEFLNGSSTSSGDQETNVCQLTTMPPEAVVAIIASYCSPEMIHWIANGTSANQFKAGLDHRMIPLADILKRKDVLDPFAVRPHSDSSN